MTVINESEKSFEVERMSVQRLSDKTVQVHEAIRKFKGMEANYQVEVEIGHKWRG